jgi:hypothetical protein
MTAKNYSEAGSALGRILATIHSRIDSPLTEQQVEEMSILTSVVESEQLLGLNGKYTIPDLLKTFQVQHDVNLDNNEEDKNVRLVDAKNIIMRNMIKNIIKTTGGYFDMSEIIPFEISCVNCRGTGELYNFFRDERTISCKHCDRDENGRATGRRTITCPACKGSGKYQKRYGSEPHHYQMVDCIKCDKDSEGNPTGKYTFKCRPCQGSGTFKKMVIAPGFKSTTTCRVCDGRGFLSPKQAKRIERKKSMKAPFTPVIDQDTANILSEKIKNPEGSPATK